ncbi:MAG: glycoside hydrolase family 43 protein [Marinilabiliaceae bacterium]|nr:glycoside hydrolase family 43 protein [Marinilabiliaceae bacterium]
MNFKKLFFLLIVLCIVFSCANRSIEFNKKEITNPVLPGFYPDPSVCKGVDGYYMVNSSFSYFPGIPIFHSPDLVHWKQIGHVLTRNSQLQVEGQAITTRGTYAPTIEYHNGTYYVTCTEVGNRGNYITTARNPAGPWSDLNFLPEIEGIDPSLFFDDDGKVYIIYNSDAPNNNPQYSGHRTIRINEVDIDSMKVIGDERILVNGGVDITKQPVWIEGPHMYKVNGYYYVSAAEGGTSVNHSQVIFQSKSIHEPFKPWDQNPILTQRHLDPNRPSPITSTGHADLIQDLNGDWWAVFLACRPYMDNHYNLGRETFMAPVQWINGWPRINPYNKEVLQKYVFQAALNEPDNYISLNGSFVKVDEFSSDTLSMDWVMIRNSEKEWYDINPEDGGKLIMNLQPYNLINSGNPSFLGRRQQHMKSNVSTSLSFTPEVESDKAGLVVFQDIGHYYFLCKAMHEGNNVVQINKAEGDSMVSLASVILKSDLEDFKLKIESDVDVYRFYYAQNDEDWVQIDSDFDASFLSTQTAGGFTGCLYGMYGFTDADDSTLSATYNWFKYEGIE